VRGAVQHVVVVPSSAVLDERVHSNKNIPQTIK
jgi:hypothetical protein